MNHAAKLMLAPPVHTLHLFRRPLHPELFSVKAKKLLRLPGSAGRSGNGGYDIEAWLLPLGHVVRTQPRQAAAEATGTPCVCELVIDRDSGLPAQGVVEAWPTAGDNDYEHVFEDIALLYNVSSQTENLSPRIYATTLSDQLGLADETGAMIHIWSATPAFGDEASTNQPLSIASALASPGTTCLSLLEVATFDDELHVSSTHMHPAGGTVVRTQSVLQRV